MWVLCVKHCVRCFEFNEQERLDLNPWHQACKFVALFKGDSVVWTHMYIFVTFNLQMLNIFLFLYFIILSNDAKNTFAHVSLVYLLQCSQAKVLELEMQGWRVYIFLKIFKQKKVFKNRSYIFKQVWKRPPFTPWLPVNLFSLEAVMLPLPYIFFQSYSVRKKQIYMVVRNVCILFFFLFFSFLFFSLGTNSNIS